MLKPLVYIASPYFKGDQIINIRYSIDIFNQLRQGGIVTPIAPLLVYSAHLVCPATQQDWVDYDFELLSHCDALLAQNVQWGAYIQTISEGRQLEIEFADAHDIAVYWSITDLYDHYKMDIDDDETDFSVKEV